MTIDRYINEFERLHNKIKVYNINLPDPVLAYRLLESANLQTTKAELIRATLTKLTYADMKSQLRKLEDSAVSSNTPQAHIKEEPSDTLYSRGASRGRIYNSRGRGVGRARYQQPSRGGARSRMDYEKKRHNPQDAAGRTTKCFICKSVYHWAHDCPNQNDEESHEQYYGEEVYITLFTKSMKNAYSGKMLGETIGCAVLDSGCSKSVCSKVWLKTYIDTLNDRDKGTVEYFDSSAQFRFGDGTTFKFDWTG